MIFECIKKRKLNWEDMHLGGCTLCSDINRITNRTEGKAVVAHLMIATTTLENLKTGKEQTESRKYE